jgi:hypothetical protein
VDFNVNNFLCFFFEEIEELREIPELREKFNKLDQGWQPAARKLFPVILLPIGKFRDFSQDIFRNFSHCSSQGRPTCSPNKTRTKILRIIGSFCHFPSSFGR